MRFPNVGLLFLTTALAILVLSKQAHLQDAGLVFVVWGLALQGLDYWRYRRRNDSARLARARRHRKEIVVLFVALSFPRAFFVMLQSRPVAVSTSIKSIVIDTVILLGLANVLAFTVRSVKLRLFVSGTRKLAKLL
jgi:hypothetical protein